METIKFREWECVIEFGVYQNKRKAILLIDAKDGQRVASCTLNLPEVPVSNDEVIIKDYSENSGVYVALREAGVIEKCHKIYSVGMAKAFCCKLTPKYL